MFNVEYDENIYFARYGMMISIENPYGVFVRANACFLLLGECPYGAYHRYVRVTDNAPSGLSFSNTCACDEQCPVGAFF